MRKIILPIVAALVAAALIYSCSKETHHLLQKKSFGMYNAH